MLNFKAAITILCGAIGILGATVPAHAQMSNVGVGAKMQIINSTGPDMHGQQTSSTAASVYLVQPGTGISVHSDMSFSSLSSDSAVFDFSIGMNGNGYVGNASGPYMGIEGPSDFNGGHLTYANATPKTWTVSYDYNVSGSDTFGMNSINIILGNQHLNLGGVTPTPGHYSGTHTYDMGPYTWHVSVGFSPNVSGGSGFGNIDGQYDGRITFNFGPVAAPVPEPEIYAMMGLGLGLLGWVGRRRKQQASA